MTHANPSSFAIFQLQGAPRFRMDMYSAPVPRTAPPRMNKQRRESEVVLNTPRDESDGEEGQSGRSASDGGSDEEGGTSRDESVSGRSHSDTDSRSVDRSTGGRSQGTAGHGMQRGGVGDSAVGESSSSFATSVEDGGSTGHEAISKDDGRASESLEESLGPDDGPDGGLFKTMTGGSVDLTAQPADDSPQAHDLDMDINRSHSGGAVPHNSVVSLRSSRGARDIHEDTLGAARTRRSVMVGSVRASMQSRRSVDIHDARRSGMSTPGVDLTSPISPGPRHDPTPSRPTTASTRRGPDPSARLRRSAAAVDAFSQTTPWDWPTVLRFLNDIHAVVKSGDESLVLDGPSAATLHQKPFDVYASSDSMLDAPVSTRYGEDGVSALQAVMKALGRMDAESFWTEVFTVAQAVPADVHGTEEVQGGDVIGSHLGQSGESGDQPSRGLLEHLRMQFDLMMGVSRRVGSAAGTEEAMSDSEGEEEELGETSIGDLGDSVIDQRKQILAAFACVRMLLRADDCANTFYEGWRSGEEGGAAQAMPAPATRPPAATDAGKAVRNMFGGWCTSIRRACRPDLLDDLAIMFDDFAACLPVEPVRPQPEAACAQLWQRRGQALWQRTLVIASILATQLSLLKFMRDAIAIGQATHPDASQLSGLATAYACVNEPLDRRTYAAHVKSFENALARWAGDTSAVQKLVSVMAVAPAAHAQHLTGGTAGMRASVQGGMGASVDLEGGGMAPGSANQLMYWLSHTIAITASCVLAVPADHASDAVRDHLTDMGNQLFAWCGTLCVHVGLTWCEEVAEVLRRRHADSLPSLTNSQTGTAQQRSSHAAGGEGGISYRVRPEVLATAVAASLTAKFMPALHIVVLASETHMQRPAPDTLSGYQHPLYRLGIRQCIASVLDVCAGAGAPHGIYCSPATFAQSHTWCSRALAPLWTLHSAHPVRASLVDAIGAMCSGADATGGKADSPSKVGHALQALPHAELWDLYVMGRLLQRVTTALGTVNELSSVAQAPPPTGRPATATATRPGTASPSKLSAAVRLAYEPMAALQHSQWPITLTGSALMAADGLRCVAHSLQRYGGAWKHGATYCPSKTVVRSLACSPALQSVCLDVWTQTEQVLKGAALASVFQDTNDSATSTADVPPHGPILAVAAALAQVSAASQRYVSQLLRVQVSTLSFASAAVVDAGSLLRALPGALQSLKTYVNDGSSPTTRPTAHNQLRTIAAGHLSCLLQGTAVASLQCMQACCPPRMTGGVLSAQQHPDPSPEEVYAHELAATAYSLVDIPLICAGTRASHGTPTHLTHSFTCPTLHAWPHAINISLT